MKRVLLFLGKDVLVPLVVSTVGVFAGIFITVRYGSEVTNSWQPETCADPRDLILMTSEELRSNSSEPQPPPPGEEHLDWSVTSLTDGSTDTPWVPLRGTEAGAWVEFSLPEDTDLALVCVVNGLPSSEVFYQNAGKARSVRVTTDQTEGAPPVVPLKVMPLDEMQQRQEVRIEPGETDVLRLELVSTYPGIDVVDPQRGTWAEAVGNVAVAEIEMYRQP
jgi:hypothetical protein